VIRAEGELDLTTMPALARSLLKARSGSAPPFLIVDLTRVTFMDGSAADPLYRAWRDCVARHGWTRVVYTRTAVGILLHAAALQHRLPRYATVPDALHGRTSAGVMACRTVRKWAT
jgi:anti-anti-sigma factor